MSRWAEAMLLWSWQSLLLIVVIVIVAATCGRLAVNDRRGGFQPVGEVVELIARRPVGDDADVDPCTGLGVVAARQAHQA